MKERTYLNVLAGDLGNGPLRLLKDKSLYKTRLPYNISCLDKGKTPKIFTNWKEFKESKDGWISKKFGRENVNKQVMTE